MGKLTPAVEPDVDGDVWGADPADEEDEPEVAPDEMPARAPESTLALGAPPAEPMAGAKWAYNMLLAHAYEANRDDRLSQAKRTSMVLKLLSGAAKHMTDAMRFDTKQGLDRARQEVEGRKRAKAAARLESRAKVPAGAKILPIRRNG